ncbi:hypothetical protein BTO04_12765 [Polaribacter sp. SA4-10]|uniref:T9SS type A sorting domain-containing protein n=1 Tax=Polaribacter sp. SA4-10 TaxID=754397 RepID=UPI000B3CE13B|nr:T9SS type A sorting domain-containing protein [Polaribacter sp. SA4-10]ARV07507.1 hypothetical protein BTO04_12765 [Polaribacter sp. SA4-10]
MNFLKKSFLVVFVLVATQLVYSQEAITASGGEATGSGGSGSYSVGQVFYTTNTTNTGSVSQGVQQVFDFQSFSIPGLTGVNLTIIVYPNPTKDFVILKITDSTFNDLRYTLFDLNGKSIANDVITASSTQIQLKHLSIGTYLLKVSQQNESFKGFKIIKRQ